MPVYAFTYGLLVAPSSNYSDSGSKLNNGVLGGSSTSQWVGWDGFGTGLRDFIRIDLGQLRNVQQVGVCFVDADGASGVNMPGEFQVSVSADDVTYEPWGSYVPSGTEPVVGTAPWGKDGTRRAVVAPGTNVQVRYLKIAMRQSTTGSQYQWMMLSEVEVAGENYTLAGLATLDTGAGATAVLVRDWSTHQHLQTIAPDAAGNWHAFVAPGAYEVTTIGPTGYQPITHGPIDPAEI